MGHTIVDHYFVIDEESKKVFHEKFQHEKQNVHTSFFPIENRFFLTKKSIHPETVAIVLTCMQKKFVVDMLAKLDKSSVIKKVLILKGRNDQLFQELQREFHDEKFVFMEFLNLKENMKDIDIILGKPG